MSGRLCIVVVALLALAADRLFAVGYQGARESKQNAVSFKTDDELISGRFVRQKDAQKRDLMAKLEVEVPRVEVELFGEKYSVGGNQVCIPVRLASGLDDGSGAQWDPNDNVIVITKKEYDWEQMEAGFKKWYLGGASILGLKNEEDVFWRKLRHEAIHAMVDTEYKKRFEDENGTRQGSVEDWYQFMSEMLAYVGGDGLSVEKAAKMIRDHPELYNTNFKAGDIADKFLKGEKYTPPHDTGNLGLEKFSPVPKLFDRDLQCKKTKECEKKVCHDSNAVKDVKTVDSADTNGKDSASEVGIKGWCRCLEKQETSGARSIMVGGGWEWFEDSIKPMPRYAYYFCLRCGKCRRPDLNSDFSSSRRIFDNQLEIQLAATNGLRTCDYVNARKDVERKFINIPDGQIVFPGKCTCKDPDPIRDGFMNNYVCVVCGRCYVPVNNTVPLGPTARREMGLR